MSIGTVGYEGGALVHHCHCGKWGAFGFDVSLREGRLGAWYCGEHRPDKSTGEQARISVTLSDAWLQKAIGVGKTRQANALLKGFKRYGVGDENPEAYHINGAVSEAGVAKHFKQPWKPRLDAVGEVDVAGVIEVRCRPIPGPGRDLGIRPKDRDKHDLPHVLVWVYTEQNYRMELVGWLYGHEGADNPARWNEPSGCWYNPPPYRPLHELEALLPSLLAAVQKS